MSRIRNANRGTFKRFKKKQGALAVQTPLSSTAVERGSTRWLNGSRVDIEGILNLIGRMNASGVVDVTGTLNGSGTNNFDGINNLTGETHLTGPTDVAGNFEIIAGGQFKAGESLIYPDGSAKFGALGIASDGRLTAGLFELRPDGSANFGTLEILADGTLNVSNDINVLNNGKIIAGQVEIWPDNIALESASITSDPTFGLYLEASGRDAVLSSLGGSARLKDGSGEEVVVRAGAIDLTAAAVRMSGTLFMAGGATEIRQNRLRISELPTITGQAANVYCNPSGVFYRIV